MSAAERVLASRLGAHVAWSRNTAETMNGKARRKAAESLDARLLAEIDPDRSLSEAERARRLQHARRAHFTRLALLAVRARQGRRSG